MDESSVLRLLGQVSAGEAAEIFRDHLRGWVTSGDAQSEAVH